MFLPRRTLLLLAAILSVAAGIPQRCEAKPKVVTSFTIIADMARNVAGDLADVQSVTKAGAEIHGYQPTPRDIVRAQGADLVLWHGMNLELWFARFLTNLGDVPSAVVSEGIEPITIGEGAYSGKPNPHAWMSPANAQIYARNIAKALAGIDPDNAAQYEANAKAYGERIAAMIAPVKARIDALPENSKWLATSEGAFSYLARDLGLKEVYIWPINSDQQGSPQQVRKVIDAVREHAIPVIFSESTVPADAAQQIARETGIAYGGILYVDSLSEADGQVPTYLDLLSVTSNTIASGLAGAGR